MIEIEPKLGIVVVGQPMRRFGERLVAIQRRRKRTRLDNRRDDELRVLIGALIAADEVRAVPDEWTRHDGAELLLVERRDRTGQGVLRVEASGTIVDVAGPMKLVRAALGDGRDDTAEGVTELRGKLARDHLEFLDHVERQAGFRRVAPFDHLVRHAVHDVVDIATELPVHRQIAARGRSVHAVGEIRQVEIVPPVERHRLDLLLIHRQAQFRLARLEDRRGAMEARS